MTFNYVIVKKEEGIATIILNRPEVRNALNSAASLELRTACQQADEDPEIRVVIITGAGDKAFCAGRDLKEYADYGTKPVDDWARRMEGTALSFIFLEKMGKPTIAAVNGYALAGGCELALACDMRIAADNAVLGLTEIDLDAFPGAGAAWLLPRIVGKSHALRMILTGDRVDAQEALRIGLVDKVIPSDRLTTEAQALAKKIASKNPSAVRVAKSAVSQAAEAPLEVGRGVANALRSLVETLSESERRVAGFWAKRPAPTRSNPPEA